ncbi:MAG: bacteriochlorophyll 4-vinyl reductase [Rhodobacteraceae bacterium]|nr:bacteriochlorophyll 4-vinyl reductase [Paracoccaceae bacterium]
MATPPKGHLKRPAGPGFMGPLSILKIAEATEELCGKQAAEELLRKAQVFRLPAEHEPVREARVADLHNALRRELPDQAKRISQRAGQLTSDFVLEHRMSKRAQTMLQSMPWAAAAWLLGRTTELNSWTFAGSGEFKVVGRLDFQLRGNPAIKGATSDEPACHYHAAQFERLFQVLIDRRMSCKEICCSATGAAHCHFRIRHPEY